MGRIDAKFTVGEVARMLAVNASALRYYDEQGIIRPSGSSDAGYRLYTLADIRRLEVVVALRSTGLSLREISEALSEPQAVDSVLQNHLSSIEMQMERLQRAKSILKTSLDAGAGVNSHTPMLSTLREVAHMHDSSDDEQQRYILEHVQTLLAKLMPGRDPLTDEQVAKLKEYLFGRTHPDEFHEAGSSPAGPDPARRTDALLRTKSLIAHPDEFSPFMNHVRPLIERLKSMPEPENLQTVQDTMMRFRQQMGELASDRATPDSLEAQACVDEYVANTARWLHMTIEEYKQWIREFYVDVSGTELPQTITSMLALNAERAQSDVLLKNFLREALEVWRRNNTTPRDRS
ncbi:MAG: hypothetical protein A2201_13460 [Alicyclobacillus sp. RIFOXYA1_FULL_53_8]|nr:MAG: hypothetical protein A2201_13460 [Alicyclobacillus sp. RIFOXYA1_FULL_53_8]